MTNCFIINRNRYSCAKAMVEYLRQIPEINPIIIDNDSTYEPLLDWYATKPCEIDFVGKNSGEAVLWVTDRINYYNLADGNYIVTDPDLDLSEVPLDVVDVLRRGLVLHQWADKCGLGLRIDNIPESVLKAEIVNHEQANWRDPLGDNYYRAAIDTTLALYRSRIHSFECVRTGMPYAAKHIDWYYTDYNSLPEDYIYYLNSIGNEHSHWSKEIKKRANL